MGFIFTLCFLVLSAGYFHGTFTQWGIWVTIENADVIWRSFPGRSYLIPIRRALCPRISWTFSFMLSYLSELMFVDISLDCQLSQRPLCGTLVRLPWTLSLVIPYSRRMMIVLRRPLHSVVCDRNDLGIFVPLPPAVLMGFTNEANIVLEAGLGKFCFSLLCWSCFTHGNKAPCFLFHVL